MNKPSRKPRNYVICIHNAGYEASLERRKLYELAGRAPNDPPAMSRIIDESGEDYLYPQDWFIPIALPTKAKRVFTTIS